jgi:hypothetical protein
MVELTRHPHCIQIPLDLTDLLFRCDPDTERTQPTHLRARKHKKAHPISFLMFFLFFSTHRIES